MKKINMENITINLAIKDFLILRKTISLGKQTVG